MIAPELYKDRYITVQTVAACLGCTDSYVYMLIQDGKLQALRLGQRALRVSQSSVENFIAANIVNLADYFAPPDPEPKKQNQQPIVTARSAWMSRR